jgi:regulator of sigma E protease
MLYLKGMTAIITIIALLLLISILVFVHELGHFLAAKLQGIPVKEFAVGFGKRIFSFKRGETTYALRLFPLGGFVELEGEETGEFRNRPAYQKLIVMLAGVTMNILFAILLLGLYLPKLEYIFSLPAIVEFKFTDAERQEKAFPLTALEILEYSAAKGDIEVGESIIGVNGTRFSSFTQFKELLDQNQGKDAEFEFINLSTIETYKKDVTVGIPEEGKGTLGVLFDSGLTEISQAGYFVKYKPSFFSGVSLTYDIARFELKAIGSLLSNSFKTGDFTEVGENVGGLPAISSQVNQVVELGDLTFLIPLGAIISISLAIFNILPLPALDGGQALIVVLETIFRRKIPDHIIGKINLAGFIFLIGLALLINVKDLFQFGWIDSVLNIFR